MATDQEIQKTYHLIIDEKNIIHLAITGSVTTVADNVEMANSISRQVHQIFDSRQDEIFNCIIDFSAVGKAAHYPSPQARQIFADLISNPRVGKVAVVSPAVLTRAIMRFVVSASIKKSNIKFFKTVADAFNWFENKIEPYRP